MMDQLFNRICDFDNDVFRNIVSLRKSENLFDDLTDDMKSTEIAIAAEMRVKQNIPDGFIQRGFHYSAAINYPFETEPYMASRYSDGSFPIWYGSLDINTTIYETAYHMMRTELNIENINENIIRERAIYNAHCKALLIDLSDKRNHHPSLIDESYDFTQQIGKIISKEGHPGLLAPSARHKAGINSIIFNPQVLSKPHLNCHLTYIFNPSKKNILVEKQSGVTLFDIKY